MIHTQLHVKSIQLDHQKAILVIHDHINSISFLQVQTNIDQSIQVQFISRLFNHDQIVYNTIK